MKNIVPIIALIAILTIFSTYTYGIISETGGQIDVEDTPYEEAYDSNAKVQTASSSIIGVMPIILGVTLLIIGLGLLKKAIK